MIKYKRILLKLSGEALAGENKNGIDPKIVDEICLRIKKLVDKKVQVGIVVGGGNFWRGRSAENMEKTTADYIGMLATAMNGLAVHDALEKIGVKAKVESAINIDGVIDEVNVIKTEEYLNNGEVVIFVCGTGHPFFTTDTAAILRAIEIKADVILLGKSIDGVYSADPKVDKNAIKYDEITFDEVLEKNLKVVDLTATALCKEHDIPILLFGICKPDNILKAALGEKVGKKKKKGQ